MWSMWWFINAVSRLLLSVREQGRVYDVAQPCRQVHHRCDLKLKAISVAELRELRIAYHIPHQSLGRCSFLISEEPEPISIGMVRGYIDQAPDLTLPDRA